MLFIVPPPLEVPDWHLKMRGATPPDAQQIQGLPGPPFSCDFPVWAFPAVAMPTKNKKDLDFSRSFAGSPKGNRTPVNAVRV